MKPIKIYAESIEKSALDQFHSAMEQEFSIQGALMPDAHTGYSLPIGAVVANELRAREVGTMDQSFWPFFWSSNWAASLAK